MNSIDYLFLKLRHLDSDTQDKFETNLRHCTSAIVFGSFAAGCERPDSDLDVLFVGKGTHKKTIKYDFIWIQPQKTLSRTWLGSELANHIAHYGICIKGNFEWRDHVFISREAIHKKQLQIYTRLIHIYTYRERMPYVLNIKHMCRPVLDLFRLIKMNDELPVPPTTMLINEFEKITGNELKDLLCQDKYLGLIGTTLIDEIFRKYPNRPVYGDILELLSKGYHR